MNTQLDHTSAKHLYAQIEVQLRPSIRRKEYLDGKKLPNELELAEKLGGDRVGRRLLPR